MEHQQDDPTDKDKTMKRTFERYNSDEEEEKRQEKAKKAKKKRQQEREEADKKTEKQAKSSEQNEAEEKKPSFLNMLIGDDEPKADRAKEQHKPEAPESAVDKAEAIATTETQSNPAELSPEEEREAALAYIIERQAQLAVETSESSEDDRTATETKANQTFLQKLADKLRGNRDSSTDEILDAAASETIAEAVDQEEAELANQSESTSATPASSSTFGGGVPPRMPAGDSGSGRGSDLGPSVFAGLPDSEPYHYVSQPVEVSLRQPESVSRSGSSGGEFLLGAFVGYLFGRRRGRLKAETEAEPVKRELEQQVRELQKNIEIRETYIRSAVHGKEIPTKKTGDILDTAPYKQPTSEHESVGVVSTEQARQSFAQSAEQAVRESLVSVSPEQQIQQSVTQPERHSRLAESVATLPLTEVLRGSDQVTYRGESLRHLYEDGRISERVLRETYREYLRGHRFEQQLEKALRQHPESVPTTPEFSAQQSSSLASQHNTMESASMYPARTGLQEDNKTINDLPPVAINPSARKSFTGKLSPGQQATVGAIIGIVVVVVILLFWIR